MVFIDSEQRMKQEHAHQLAEERRVFIETAQDRIFDVIEAIKLNGGLSGFFQYVSNVELQTILQSRGSEYKKIETDSDDIDIFYDRDHPNSLEPYHRFIFVSKKESAVEPEKGLLFAQYAFSDPKVADLD